MERAIIGVDIDEEAPWAVDARAIRDISDRMAKPIQRAFSIKIWKRWPSPACLGWKLKAKKSSIPLFFII